VALFKNEQKCMCARTHTRIQEKAIFAILLFFKRGTKIFVIDTMNGFNCLSAVHPFRMPSGDLNVVLYKRQHIFSCQSSAGLSALAVIVHV